MPCGGCGGYRKVERPAVAVASPPSPTAVAIPPAPPIPPIVIPASQPTIGSIPQQVEILAVSSTPSKPINVNETITDLVKKKREALLALRRSQHRQY